MSDTTGAAGDPSDEEPTEFILPPQSHADRLDKVLAGLLPEHSRSRLQGWIENGCVLVNGNPARVRQPVGAGDILLVWPQAPLQEQAFLPEPVSFAVIGESPYWIVVDKPAGLVTHPGAGNWGGTLLNGLLHRYPELAQLPRAGIVHRLDKDTSGLLVVARNEVSQTHLVRQLQARTMGREYVALVHGRTLPNGTVDRPIGRDARVPVRMSVERPVAPKPARTHYTTSRYGQLGQVGVAEVACRLESGRTHQIRVHLASLGHPLVGDVLYNGRHLPGAERQMLHAWRLTFEDPAGGGGMTFEAAVPPDMLQLLETVQWDG